MGVFFYFKIQLPLHQNKNKLIYFVEKISEDCFLCGNCRRQIGLVSREAGPICRDSSGACEPPERADNPVPQRNNLSNFVEIYQFIFKENFLVIPTLCGPNLIGQANRDLRLLDQNLCLHFSMQYRTPSNINI